MVILLATRLTALTISVVFSVGAIDCANAKPLKQRYSQRSIESDYGPSGPNTFYQVGPRTRVYVTRRSWLDAGVEVLPSDRKFNDYAFSPGTSFARQNKNSPIDRQPLNPPSDFGGVSQSFPF